jgi:hypothetical protein
MKLDEPDLRIGDLLCRKGGETVYCLIARRGDTLDVCRHEDANALFPFLFNGDTFSFPMIDMVHINTKQFAKIYKAEHGKDLPRQYDMQTHKWVLGVGRGEPDENEEL